MLGQHCTPELHPQPSQMYFSDLLKDSLIISTKERVLMGVHQPRDK